MQLNTQRFWQNLMVFAEITDPQQPYTRRSFSERFLAGRAWLTQKIQQAGLTTRIDSAGNLIGRKEGKSDRTIMIGSHSDTVPAGGRFDGIAGVLAGIEFAQSLHEQQIPFHHNLEIVDFLAEEPSEWGLSCIGSRGITGFLSKEHLALKHPQTNETLANAIIRMGGQPSSLTIRQDLAAFFELHIEQGVVLEQTKTDIGIVSGIVGIIRLAIHFQGKADHAGATPMSMRHNALLAAAGTILQADSLAQQFANRQQGYFVATCGQLLTEPNASNVIPSHCKLVFDIRSDQRQLMDEFVHQLRQIAQNNAQQAVVICEKFAILSDTQPVHCDPNLQNLLSANCERQKIRYRQMPSGAGHDTAFLSHITPSVMLFVPSLAGKSHCPEEWTSFEQLSHGLNVLAQAVLAADQKIVSDTK